MTKFYDTSALLLLGEKAFEEPFVISSITLKELENIKTSRIKSEEIKYAARKIVRLLNTDKSYEIYLLNSECEALVNKADLPASNDNLIVACAVLCSRRKKLTFVTDDLVLKTTAKLIFSLPVISAIDIIVPETRYYGYKEVTLSVDETCEFYDVLGKNTFNCLTNEYLLIYKENGELFDALRWTGETHVPLYKKSIKSMFFEDRLKPKDVYQQMVIDSIMNNTITAIGGKAGSGKTLLTLISAMHLIESGKYSRLIIMFNPTSVRGASRLGYYAGSMEEKAMQTSIGNILTTKFGERYTVDNLLSQDTIKLVSMADCRGMEVGDNEILFVSECQNTSIDLLKLVLSRASQGAKIIIEGDFDSQVDELCFEGDNNGMRRAVEVLKGEDIFGYVELKNVWRSKIAELVDKM